MQNILWATNFGLTTCLLVLLMARKHYREFPVFSVYTLTVLLYHAAIFAGYRRWGFDSKIYASTYWTADGVTVLVRSLMVIEICRRLLGAYRGVWALAWRVLLVCTACSLLYSLLVAHFQLQYIILYAHRGLELTTAAAVVTLFFFASYYEITPDPRIHSLVMGLCLYSCFCVMNDSILEFWRDRFVNVWTFLGMLAYFATQVIWIQGFYKPVMAAASEVVLLPKEVYGSVSPLLNLQLRQLNQTLSRFFAVEELGQ